MSRQAKWSQATRIWSWCVKYGNKNANWMELAHDGKLDYETAERILNFIEQGKMALAAEMIADYISGFKLVKDEDGQPAKTENKTEGESKAEKKKPRKKASSKEAEKDGKIIIEKLQNKLQQLAEVIDVKHIEDLKGLILENIEVVKKSTPKHKVKSPDYIKPKVFDEITTLVKNKVQVLLTGAAGCGKSRLFQEVAAALDMPFFTFSMAGGMRYSQVFGREQIFDGHSDFVEGQLLKAIQKPQIVFIDEIFGADSDVILGLNSITEPNTRKIETPKGTIKVHPECRIVAAANTTGRQFNKQYTGAKRADDSLLDRFICYRMEYDSGVEKGVLEKMGLNKEESLYLLEQLSVLRRKIRENNISFDPSTRRLIQAAKLIQIGLKKERAFELAFLSPLSKAEHTKVAMDSEEK